MDKHQSDRAILIAMFDRAGVCWENEPSDSWRKRREYTIRVTAAPNNSANDGYTDFYTTFVFDADDTLLSVGAWE